MRLWGAVCMTALFSSCTAYEPVSVTAIIGGQLIDGTGAPAVPDAVIVLENERILAAGPPGTVEVPENAEIIDASGLTLLPGLIESNSHVVFNGQIDHAAFFATRYGDYYEIGARNLFTALQQGITTIRDTLGPLDTLLELRRDVATNKIAGSQLSIAGPILNYESLLDIPTERQLDARRVAAARASLDAFIDNQEQGLAAIRRLAERDVDLIKISVEGNAPDGPRPVELPEDVLASMIAEARRLGLPTTSHTMTLAGLERALAAGFDAMEHPEIVFTTANSGVAVPITDDLIQRIVEDGIYSVPLLVAMEAYITFLRDPNLISDAAKIRDLPADLVQESRDWLSAQAGNPNALETRLERYAVTRDNLRRLIDAGAIIAMGTDKGTRFNFHEHANHVRELESYVELGMNPMTAIESATRRGAELLGLSAEIGTLEPGKRADLIGVAGDPLEDIRIIGNVELVFKDGRRYK